MTSHKFQKERSQKGCISFPKDTPWILGNRNCFLTQWSFWDNENLSVTQPRPLETDFTYQSKDQNQEKEERKEIEEKGKKEEVGSENSSS